MSDLGAILALRWSYHDAYPTSRDAVVALQAAQQAVADLIGSDALRVRVRLLELARMGLPRETCIAVVLACGAPIPA